MCKDGKEKRQLKLVPKNCTIGECHRVYYLPALEWGRYYSTSYRLAAQCCQERRKITLGSVSSHRDYGERLSVLFNKKIQNEYFQNTSVSVEGVSLEWIGVNGAQHTGYFGHWSDDLKQCAAAMTHNIEDPQFPEGRQTTLTGSHTCQHH